MMTLRRLVQIATFGAFLYLFAMTVGHMKLLDLDLLSAAPVDTFFRLDPLIGVSTMIATRQLIEVLVIFGLPVILLTALMGRFFCGWICPLGTTLDAADATIFRGRGRSSGESSFPRTFKYYLLLAVIAASAAASNLVYFVDPIVILTRALTFSIYGPVQFVLRAIGSTDLLTERAPFLMNNPYFYSDHQSFYRMNFVFFLIFAAIVGLNGITRRFWCRHLCPLGAMLGLISSESLIKRLVHHSCTGCSTCSDECKMSCIGGDPTMYMGPECVYCYSCTKSCPQDATKIVPALSSPQFYADLDLKRRRGLQALGFGLAWAALAKTNWAMKKARGSEIKISSPELIRPPGALPEEEFLATCVRCSECMKVCPTNGLQPSLVEAGLDGLWSPVLVPRIGECTENCNLCSKVCSTQAIRPFKIEEKPHIYIGRAVIDRNHCIAWNSEKPCLVCDEYCSYHALNWKVVDGVRRPFVDEKKCTGCGICENACPIQPQAAVRVFSFGDKRHMSRDEQKRWGESKDE